MGAVADVPGSVLRTLHHPIVSSLAFNITRSDHSLRRSHPRRSYAAPLDKPYASLMVSYGVSSDFGDTLLHPPCLAIRWRLGSRILPVELAPQAIEHLSDNGSAYTARNTRLFSQALNLTPCFTPVASPQSNGMSEAFVKTLKRDYIRISVLPDAETALRFID